MSTLHELEIRVLRVEKRWDESDQEFHEAMNEVARFQERITRVTCIAAAIATAAALRVGARYWIQVSEGWSTAFGIVAGVLVYALLAAWLDRWQVQERDELRRRYYKPSVPEQSSHDEVPVAGGGD